MFGLLNKLTLAQKMIVIFVCSVFIPIIFQFALLYANVEKRTEEEIEERLTKTLDSKSDAILGEINGVFSLIRKYEKDLQINEELDKIYTSDLAYYENYNLIKEHIVTDVPYYLQIEGISIYTDNPSIFYGGYVKKLVLGSTFNERESILSSHKDETNNVNYVFSTNVDRTRLIREKNVTVVREIQYFEQHSKHKRFIRIDFNLSYMSKVIEEVGLFEKLYIVDNDNRIIFTSDITTIEDIFQIFDMTSQNKDYQLYEKQLDSLPFKIYGVYDRSTFSHQFDEYRQYNVMTALVSIAFASVFIYIIAANITKRMKKVVTLSEQISLGNFVQLKGLEIKGKGRDEFSELETSMNEMSYRLENLIDNEYKSKLLQVELEKETTKAKLFALQSQVNPHFLFNALESIRLKAYARDEKLTATMIKYMAKMFRNLIEWEDEVIPLSEEMKFLHQFLEIQKYRFEDEFSYEFSIDPSIEAGKIPKMIIQPLVENASIHGTGNRDENFNIQIIAKRDGDYILIQVIDNGIGMTPEKLEEIRYNMQQDAYTKNVGVYNVYQRLKLFYKEDYKFTINSQLGRGTISEMRLPFLIP